MAKFMVRFTPTRSYLEQIVENSKIEGKIPNNLEPTTAYSRAIEETDNTLIYHTHIGIHPLNQKAKEALVEHSILFTSPLSIISNVYAGEKPEFYLVQKRNKKGVNQGQLAIMPASAGFITYRDSAEKTAFKETSEETGLGKEDLIQIAGETPLHTCDGQVMHYLGPKRIRNPCFVYTFKTNGKTENKKDGDYLSIGKNSYRIVKKLNDLDSITEQNNDEVFAMAAVPISDLTEFWQEVKNAKRDFGPSIEVVNNFLASYS